MGAAVAFIAAVTLTMITAGTAHAEVFDQGANWAEAIRTSSGHQVRAYDGESDGNGVYADFYLVSGGHGSVWDGNGADRRAGSWFDVGEIARIRVCEDHGRCSNWTTYKSG